MDFVPRGCTDRLRRTLRNFPAVLVYGPRQCGKSTLVRHLYADWLQIDLERPADLALLQADLEGFLDRHPRRVLIDEAQRWPELFPALRYALDRHAGNGRFILTGSSSPDLLRTVSESLAGRIGLVELTPFRSSELAGRAAAAGRWFWGGYPPVLARRGLQARGEWMEAYVSTFLERDLPSLGIRLPAARLRKLWTMLTHLHGGLLSVSDLARSLGVSSHTIANDLDVLEGSFLIRRLQPFHANIQKRLTKSPKVYLRDTGLLHFLAGLRRPAELDTWPRRGSSFEGLVIEELATWAADQSVRPGIYFWRTQAGGEVDLLIEQGDRIIPIEVKAGTSVEARDVAGLRHCMADLGLRQGYVVTMGRDRRSLTREIELVPWSEIAGGTVPFRT